MPLPQINGEFRAVDDTTLKFTDGGKAWAKVRLVASGRKKAENGEWEDVDTSFLDGVAWDKQAENMAETVTKGMLVIVTGRLRVREYTTKENEKRTSTEILIENIGPSTRWDAAQVIKGQRQQAQSDPRREQAPAPSAPSDPWGIPSSQDDEPPF